MAGIKTIIGLSFILAIGFLLVILSAALFHNYLTLLVVATYVIAPLPNWLCGRAANHDDFMESSGNGVVDFGRFLTGFFVVMGIDRMRGYFIKVQTDQAADLHPALPTLLWHSAEIAGGAAAMSIFGGLLIYATIISFTLFFQEQEDF